MSHSITFSCPTVADTQALARVLGSAVRGGEVIEFHSDLGGGKTTFVKGLGKGMGLADDDIVQSPTFVISQIHKAARNLELHHFDFYRLNEPGVMRAELAESLQQPNAVVAIEWGDIIHDILPANRITIRLSTPSDETRVVEITTAQDYIFDVLQTYKEQGHMT